LKVTVIVCLAMVGCASAEPTPLSCCQCDCPATPAAAAPAAPAAVVTPAAKATKAYRAAERTIAPAVTSDAATVAYIKAVEKADRLSRDALRLLVSQDGHPTPAAIGDARKRLDYLIRTLDTPQ
jgi:hypothetical protein